MPMSFFESNAFPFTAPFFFFAAFLGHSPVLIPTLHVCPNFPNTSLQISPPNLQKFSRVSGAGIPTIGISEGPRVFVYSSPVYFATSSLSKGISTSIISIASFFLSLWSVETSTVVSIASFSVLLTEASTSLSPRACSTADLS